MKNLRGYWGGGSSASSKKLKNSYANFSLAGGISSLALNGSIVINREYYDKKVSELSNRHDYIIIADSLNVTESGISFDGQYIYPWGGQSSASETYGFVVINTSQYFLTAFNINSSVSTTSTHLTRGEGATGASAVSAKYSYFSDWAKIPLKWIAVGRDSNKNWAVVEIASFSRALRSVPYFSTIKPGETEADGNLYFCVPAITTYISSTQPYLFQGVHTVEINGQTMTVGEEGDGITSFGYWSRYNNIYYSTASGIEHPGTEFTLTDTADGWGSGLTFPPPADYEDPITTATQLYSVGDEGGSATRKFNGRYIT